MAVRQLAGPFSILDDKGTVINVVNPSVLMYLPKYGLVGTMTYGGLTATYIGLIALDGVAQRLNAAASGVPWYWNDTNQTLVTNSFVREPIILGAYPYTAATPSLPSGVYSGAYLSNRTLYATGNGVYSAIAGGAFTLECPLPFPNFGMNVGPGRKPGELFLSYAIFSSGYAPQFCFYDTINKVVSSPIYNLGQNATTVVYSPDLNILIAFNYSASPQTISIFSLDVVPASLSAVTLRSGLVQSGCMAVYQVKINGANSDFCSGLLVDWSLTGVGTLIDTQTTSDATGYATCRVLYAAGTTGATAPTASVTC